MLSRFLDLTVDTGLLKKIIHTEPIVSNLGRALSLAQEIILVFLFHSSFSQRTAVSNFHHYPQAPLLSASNTSYLVSLLSYS